MKNKAILLKDYEEKNKQKFICKRPFELMELDMEGNVYLCFPRCNNKSYIVGNLYNQTYEEICSSPAAIEFKKDILNSVYQYCDFNYCAAPDTELQLSKIDDSLLDVIYPEECRLHIDNLCNLKCIMCRNEYITKFSKQKEFEEILIPRIVSMVRNAKKIFMNGNGEVFFSPLAKTLIQEITKTNKNVKFDFCTNGLNFTQDFIEEYNLKDRIEHVSFSMHAIKEKTYKKLTNGGNFKKLLKNIEYAKELRNSIQPLSITLNFVINLYNYKEILDFQRYADKNNFEVFYSALVDTNTMQNYDEISIKDEKSKDYQNLIRILNDPILDKNGITFDNQIQEIRSKTINNNQKTLKNILKNIFKK